MLLKEEEVFGMSKYNEKVTILSPTYLCGTKHPTTGSHTHSLKSNWYQKVFNSYYTSFKKPYPVHHIKDDSAPRAKKELEKYLQTIGANYKLVATNEKTNGFHALIKLIESVETEYMFFILDDVMQVKPKDFITPCVELMEEQKDILQVKLGSGFAGSGNNNKDNVVLLGNGKAAPKVAPESVYTANSTSTGDVVWTMQLEPKNIRNVFPLSYYNCIMRTEYVKRIHEVVMTKGVNKTGRDFSTYLEYMNYTNDTNNLVNEKGWPSGFEFISEYKTGWLNFASYIYHLGRAGRSLERAKQHANTHTHEIKG